MIWFSRNYYWPAGGMQKWLWQSLTRFYLRIDANNCSNTSALNVERQASRKKNKKAQNNNKEFNKKNINPTSSAARYSITGLYTQFPCQTGSFYKAPLFHNQELMRLNNITDNTNNLHFVCSDTEGRYEKLKRLLDKCLLTKLVLLYQQHMSEKYNKNYK